jgi:hypothetical protein
LYFWISGSREAATPTVIVVLGVVSVNVFSTLSRVVSPQSLLAAQSFIERYRLQLVHDSRTCLHHPVSVPQQLPEISIFPVRYPDLRKIIFEH